MVYFLLFSLLSSLSFAADSFKGNWKSRDISIVYNDQNFTRCKGELEINMIEDLLYFSNLEALCGKTKVISVGLSFRKEGDVIRNDYFRAYGTMGDTHIEYKQFFNLEDGSEAFTVRNLEIMKGTLILNDKSEYTGMNYQMTGTFKRK